MAQFDVYRNANPATRARIPYLLDIQSDLLDSLATRVVVPLCKPGILKGRLAERLNPVFEVEGREVAMLTPELAGVPAKALGKAIGNLSGQRGVIIAALDLVITGI
jgi:toxin CcdB